MISLFLLENFLNCGSGALCSIELVIIGKYINVVFSSRVGIQPRLAELLWRLYFEYVRAKQVTEVRCLHIHIFLGV